MSEPNSITDPPPLGSQGTSAAPSRGARALNGLWITAGVLALLYAVLIAIQLITWWIDFGWPMTMPEDPLMILGGLLAALAGFLVFLRFTMGVPWLLIASFVVSELLARRFSMSGWYWIWPWQYAESFDMNRDMFGSGFIVVWILRGTAPYVLIAAIIVALIALARTEYLRRSYSPERV